MAERVGFEPTWAFDPNGFQDRPVMTTSVPLGRTRFIIASPRTSVNNKKQNILIIFCYFVVNCFY